LHFTYVEEKSTARDDAEKPETIRKFIEDLSALIKKIEAQIGEGEFRAWMLLAADETGFGRRDNKRKKRYARRRAVSRLQVL